MSPELRELRLILANSSTRVLSPAEVSKQAQRVETLLYQLKEQGYAFPGRMRDQVAAACKVSAPKLARLKVIREHLIPIYLEHFDRNVLSEQTAYALARMETALQERLANMLPNLPTGSRAEELLELAKAGTNWRPTFSCPDGLRLVATLVNACAPRPRQPERRRGMRRRPKRPNATQKSKRTSKRMCSSGPRGWPRPQMPLGWKMRHPSSSQSMDGA